MEYTLASAAKAAGVHKASIHRAIKSGKLSARRLEDGTYRIDASELSRVYPVKPPATERAMVHRDDPRPPSAPPETSRDGESATVIALLREQLEREKETVADLRSTVSRLLLALPAPEKTPEKPEPPHAVEDLQKRLEDAEARISALTAPEKPVERPVAVETATRVAQRKSLLARLLGRG